MVNKLNDHKYITKKGDCMMIEIQYLKKKFDPICCHLQKNFLIQFFVNSKKLKFEKKL